MFLPLGLKVRNINGPGLRTPVTHTVQEMARPGRDDQLMANVGRFTPRAAWASQTFLATMWSLQVQQCSQGGVQNSALACYLGSGHLKQCSASD
jgi:hypothetical protein